MSPPTSKADGEVPPPDPPAVPAAKLLICDDSATIRLSLQRLLSPPHQCLLVSSGEAALAAYDEFRPDLVITDLTMGGMNGLELVACLGKMPAMANVPVIVLTSQTSYADRETGLELGVADYLFKPVRKRELLARVKSLLSLQRATQVLQLKTTELQRANEELQQLHSVALEREIKLRAAQKLEAVGRLSAGVAHEINTPVQFVTDSVQFVHDALADLFKLQLRMRQLAEHDPAVVAQIDAAELEADYPYLSIELPKSLKRALDGLERVATIVKAMNSFARADQKEKTPTDLNLAIASTLTIASSEYKFFADLKTEFGELPPVTCHAGQINQVVLNLICNAAHAISDKMNGAEHRGTIAVKTWREAAGVVVAISDTGAGIPEALRERIFDPFFTTKEVGRGSGQGLTISRNFVLEHRGSLSFETELGVGTTFFIRLPLV